ncbi:NAD(P)/FAD-dependent oxidoreductase [Companilactobacillus alimentarius]|uniref:NADH dehydrogenase n=1 Tax=Companilactobacillus alimentarius DSM 20249 TaxID=1423720 RepID=A0A2K9HHY6_9LACO|nr:NAD(P)/FAD-dependent oxidoreductase [Companilactobacillus alimentarius]AUI72160.1 NADH dehydrogenase [Companilactobacillus alimentarius DSM 20249]GEO44939.1 NADH dehydrogenase [Companilactobacillus alimentarius]
MAHILVLGAGYGGLRAARDLAKSTPAGTQIDLIDKSDKHVEKTALHTIAAGTNRPDAVSFEIRSVLPSNVNFIKATVSKLDLDNKTVEFSDHEAIKYDYIVVSLGFRSEDFGLEGASENALILQDLETAKNIYKKINEHIANYKESQDPKDLSIIVCGAGFTGVEILGELVDTVKILKAKYDVPEIKVTCLEMATRILPMFDENLASYAVEYLDKNGINLLTGAKIKKIEKQAVVYMDGDTEKRVEGSTILWTVGVSGSDVIKSSGIDAKRNRVMTTQFLNLEAHPEAYFIGDDSAIIPKGEKRPYPTTGQLATAEGAGAAFNIAAALNGKDLKPFVYKSMGTVASLGQNHGIAEITGKNLKFKGSVASLLKHLSADRGIMEIAGLKTAIRKGTI